MIPLSTLVTITRRRRHRADDPLQPAALGRDPGRARAAATRPGRRSPRWSRCSRRRCPRRWASPTRRCPTRRRSRRPPAPTFIMAIVCVFLLLAALYESWRLPWAVLLGLAAGRPGRLLRRLADGLRQQRLRADRPGDADRAGGQERDPDRRVRQGEARRGRVARGGGAGVGAPALPADPDDGLRLHPGRRAADAGDRRRRGRPERDGHRRVLGHAGRHRAGRVHHPGQLHLRRGARSPPEGRAKRRPRRRARKEPIDR